MAASFLTTLSNAFSWLKNVIISIKISLKFVLKGSINNIPTLVQIMAWHWPGDKPLSEQWWLDYRRIYMSLGLNELTMLVDLVWGTTTEAMISSSQLMWSIAIILPGLFPIDLWVFFLFFFPKVVATFNHVGGSFNHFMATSRDVWIPKFRIWDYMLHVEHISCVIINCGQHPFYSLNSSFSFF